VSSPSQATGNVEAGVRTNLENPHDLFKSYSMVVYEFIYAFMGAGDDWAVRG
jgi:hypothetical protein